MPSTYSPNLRIELIASGEQANTWGITTNTNLGTLIEEAISGITTIDVTAGNVTLTALNGVTDQSRQMILNVTGTPGTARQITAPAVSKVYIIANGSDDDVSIITVLAGDSVTVPAGVNKIVFSDGTGFFEADFTNLLTPSRAVVTDGAGTISVSSVTSTEVGYLSGVTSNIQTQISAIQGDITTLEGDITTLEGDVTTLEGQVKATFALSFINSI